MTGTDRIRISDVAQSIAPTAEDRRPQWMVVVEELKTLATRERIMVFGSVAKGTARNASDVDVFIGSDVDPQGLMTIARKLCGMLDPFRLDDTTGTAVLMTRDAEARWWIRARNSRALLEAVRRDGVPLMTIATDRRAYPPGPRA